MSKLSETQVAKETRNVAIRNESEAEGTVFPSNLISAKQHRLHTRAPAEVYDPRRVRMIGKACATPKNR